MLFKVFNIGGGSPNNAKGIFLSAVKAIKMVNLLYMVMIIQQKMEHASEIIYI